MGKKCISGTATYDILNDYEYKNRFYYKGIETRNHKLDFTLSDVVTRFINFGGLALNYKPDEELEFNMIDNSSRALRPSPMKI